MGRFIAALMIAAMVGCATAPPRAPFSAEHVWAIDRPRDQLMRAAVVGMFRAWQRPPAAVRYQSQTLGIIVLEGSTHLGSTRVAGLRASSFVEEISFRVVVEVADGRVRAVVEGAGQHGPGVYLPGLTSDQTAAFQQQVDQMMSVLETTLRTW